MEKEGQGETGAGAPGAEGGSSTGVSRSQNVVYVMPHDWASISRFLAPVTQRIDEKSSELQALIVTSSDELAAEVASK